MKPLPVFRWFMSAAIASLIPATIQTTAAHSMGGGMGGGHGGMRMAPHFSSGRGFRHFDHRRDFAFRHHGDDRFFFRHQNRFFFGFDFAAFGFPWWYPYSYPYPYYDGDPYGYSSYDYGSGYDYQYWTGLAVSVQSELARRGYYHGAIDGVIGSDSIQAIRGFQAAQGLPVTGRINPKLLKDLRVSYNA
jgi:Putative peptidoglycan binding domain